MTRIESDLLDLAENLLRNDDVARAEDYQTLYGLAADAGEVEKESAELRKLAKHYAEIVYELGCSFCPYVDDYPDKCEPHHFYPYVAGCQLRDDMHELGIKVEK